MSDHKRKCWTCGNIAMHADNITPDVLCKECGSQDTRLVREKSPAVRPLKTTVMTLDELRTESLSVLSQCRDQLRHYPFDKGMNDEEFIEAVLEPFMRDIKQDQYMENQHNQAKGTK